VKHVVCYSGGHSSALVAVEVARKFGAANTVLLNHDIHFTVEHADVKRFKREVADYLSIPITYANYKDVANSDQFDICVSERAFKGSGKNATEICTSRLKTRPFHAWLAANAADFDCIAYYGFDNTPKELGRMRRRVGIMAAMGYRSDYPLALWQERTIGTTEEIGIPRPSTYDTFIHGNCIGCIKAGWQHWYIVYCTRPDIWLKAKWAEDDIGYAIHHDENGQQFLEDWEPRFAAMKAAGIVPTELTPHQRFWADARKVVPIKNISATAPCEVCTG
jgi:hypothetical protein